MSSEAITRNDLKAVLDEVLPVKSSEYRKMIWANPISSATTWAGQTITLSDSLSNYDDCEVTYYGWTIASTSSKMSLRFPAGVTSKLWSIDANQSTRNITLASGTQMTFADGLLNGSTNNSACIPYKIYGIKYERVAPPQVDASDYVVEQGAGYRKWDSGVMEQWGAEASASSANHPVTLPVPFVSNDYIVLGTNTSGYQSNFMTSNINASYFYVYPVSSVRLFWIAIGRWK